MHIKQEQHFSASDFYVKRMPVVDFDADGVKAQVEFYTDDYLSSFSPGDSVTIVYDGDQQGGRAAIMAFVGYWVTPNEFMISLLICAVGIGLIRILYRPKSDEG